MGKEQISASTETGKALPVHALLEFSQREGFTSEILKDPLPSDLSDFFTKMTDPSVLDFEELAKKILTWPEEDLRSVHITLQTLSYESMFGKTLISKGFAQEEAERLQEGADSAYELMEEVSRQLDDHDYLFGMGEESTELNPKAIAEKVSEWTEVLKDENKIRQDTELIKKEPGLEKRNRLGRKLKKDVLTFIEKYNVTFGNPLKKEGEEFIEGNWKNLTGYLGWHLGYNLNLKHGEHNVMGYSFINEAVKVVFASKKDFLSKKR